MKIKYIVLALLFTSAVITGCAGQIINEQGVKEPDKAGENVVMTKERSDDWKAEEKTDDVSSQNLSIPASEAERVEISFEEKEKKGIWDSYKGGAEADYAVASTDEGAPKEIQAIIDDYNKWAVETADKELNEATARWERYNARDPDSFIALTPWIGMKLTRSDTSIISFATRIRRYNREYEPDADYLYGHTFDAGSGRELGLWDFVSDLDALTDVLLDTLKIKSANYSGERKEFYLDENFKKRVRESVKGNRRDGLFAFSVSPTGFVFYLADPFYKEDYLYYDVEEVEIPFSLCSGFLCKEVEAAYDYVSSFPTYYLEKVYGYNAGDKHYYSAFGARKDGGKYLYLPGDDEVLSYRVSDTGLEYLGSTIGDFEYNDHPSYETVIDPENIGMQTSAYLLVELLNLRATARIGEDGMLEYKELFVPEYNIFPMLVTGSFEAEVFADEKDEHPTKKVLKENTELFFVRTDAQSFIDLEISGSGEICRLYITGNDEEGFMVNGHPVDQVMQTEIIYEE